MRFLYENRLEASWVHNQGSACTSAAVLAALGGLGAVSLPDLATGSTLLAGSEYGAPALLDYVSLPGRRAPLDLRIEELARGCGLDVDSRTGIVVPLWQLRPRDGEALIVHLAWGQEKPGQYGAWGWNPLQPATYSTGGHSVVLVRVDETGWTVLDPNLEHLQEWPRAGIATATTHVTPSGRG
ncbi:MAG: hypothetical protein E6I70_11700 [Chloroflexi bacterium]|nr:MAG: hypothetical protein E6I70_11700 [Chloroflexota bacterium]